MQGFMGEDAPRYTGMTDAFKKIYAAEGIVGFYRGLIPNYVKVVPAIAVSFYIYEELKIYFNVHSKH